MLSVVLSHCGIVYTMYPLICLLYYQDPSFLTTKHSASIALHRVLEKVSHERNIEVAATFIMAFLNHLVFKQVLSACMLPTTRQCPSQKLASGWPNFCLFHGGFVRTILMLNLFHTRAWRQWGFGNVNCYIHKMWDVKWTGIDSLFDFNFSDRSPNAGANHNHSSTWT